MFNLPIYWVKCSILQGVEPNILVLIKNSMKNVNLGCERTLDYLSTRKGRRFNKPTFGDLLTAADVIKVKDDYKIPRRESYQVPITQVHSGYNKTTVELFLKVVMHKGKPLTKVKQITIGGNLSYTTLRKRFGNGLRGFWYTDSRTQRCSEIITLR